MFAIRLQKSKDSLFPITDKDEEDKISSRYK